MHPTITAKPADSPGALESAKLQALYHFAYGLSHEINNPLANIATRAQTLLLDEPDPERRRKLATIVQQAFRAHEMIADLMLFARPPALRVEQVDLSQLADTIVAEMQEQAREQGTKLSRTGDAGPLMTTGDPTQLGVALKALVQNALEALKTGGAVEVGVSSCDKFRMQDAEFRLDAAHGTPAVDPKSAIPNLKLFVADTGPGIPPEIRSHLFDPFFCGREAGRGLGLGLSKAWRIAELHGGAIEVDSPAGRGATFAIVLSPPGPDAQMTIGGGY